MLDHYWNLASLDQSIRLDAAQSLCSELKNRSEIPLNADGDVEDNELPEDLAYGLKRLIRGLPSSRGGARQGFAIALTELLQSIPEIPISYVLDLLEQSTVVTKSMKGQEQKDLYFGKLFGLRAICLSGCIVRESCSDDDLSRIFATIFTCYHAKSFLREACYDILIRILLSLADSGESQRILSRKEQIKNAVGDVSGVEELWLAMTIQKHPSLDCLKLVRVLTSWPRPKTLLHIKNVEKLATIFKDASYTNPRLHSIWDATLDLILNNQNSHMSLRDFWKSCVEEPLMVSNHERKYLALQVVSQLLPRIESEDFGLVLSPRIIRCLVDNTGKPKNLLCNAANTVVQQIQDIAKSDSQKCLQVLMKTFDGAGPAFFAKLDKNNKELLESSLNEEDVLKFIEHLQEKITGSDENLRQSSRSEETNPDSLRTWYLDQLLSVARNSRIPKSHDALFDVSHFLFTNAVSNESSLSKYVQKQCGSRLLAFLAEAFKPKDTDTTQVLAELIFKLLGTLSEGDLGKLQIASPVKLAKKIAKEAQSEQESADSASKKSFACLLACCVLHGIVTGDTLEDTVQELCELSTRLFDKPSAKKKRKSDNENDENIVPIDVLVDVLISLLSQPSLLFRRIAMRMFDSILERVTTSCVDLIFSAISLTQNEVDVEESDEENDAEIDDDDDDDADSDDDEVNEVVDNTHSSNSRDLMDSSNVDESEENQSDDDVDDDGMIEFDAKIAEIFREKKRLASNKKNAKVAILHMKLRFCDLIESLFGPSVKLSIILYSIPKLLATINSLRVSKDTKDIASKLESVFKKLLRSKHSHATGEIGPVSECLREVHTLATRTSSSEMAKILADCSVFLVRIALHISPDALGKNFTIDAQQPEPKRRKKANSVEESRNPILSSFAEVLKIFLTSKKSNVHISVLQRPLNAFPSLCVEMLPEVLDVLSHEALSKGFQLSQAFAVLATIYSNSLAFKGNPENLKNAVKSLHRVSDLLDGTLSSIIAKDSEKKGFTPERLKVIFQQCKAITKALLTYDKTIKVRTFFLMSIVNSQLIKVSEVWNLKDTEVRMVELFKMEKYSKPSLKSSLRSFVALIESI
ncbi:DNA-directed DNA polymerase [Phlyctochytrium planicorne]|nr:DNA-directed DNA polymerase [Phlyctochytrium planicorne]